MKCKPDHYCVICGCVLDYYYVCDTCINCITKKKDTLTKEKAMNKQREFKKGDKVWSPMYGDGEVIDISMSEDYPIVVQYANRHQPYTEDGKYCPSHIAPTLFHEKPDCYKTKKVVEVEVWSIVCHEGEVILCDESTTNLEGEHKVKLTGSYEVWE